MVQKTGGNADVGTSDSDLAYSEAEVPPSDTNRESESNNGYYYIAAPNKQSGDSKKTENDATERSQEPSDTQEFRDVNSLSNSDKERAPESDSYDQPLSDQQESSDNSENVEQPPNNDQGQLDQSNNQNQQQSKEEKKKLRRPKNIDEPQQPQSKPQQN
jgi:hypothetical protein